MGSTLMGPLQKSNEFRQIEEKVRPGTFGEIKVDLNLNKE